jgi:GxxExxY protein
MLVDEQLTQAIIGACIEVHKHLGPGLLESCYSSCLRHELTLRGLPWSHEVPLPVIYKGIKIDCGYRMDLVVGDRVVVELKAVDEIAAIHEAQLMSYLRLSQKRVGLLINFNVKLLIDGVTRRVI